MCFIASCATIFRSASSPTSRSGDDLLTGEFAVFIATGRGDGDLSEVTKAVQPMKFPGNAREAIEQQKTFTYSATIGAQ
jgi:hypothetical protein